ncbi:MAG: Histone acetyltransferase HPA2 and related acetyltransferases [uncultured Paraburkholderia sp.]|nr:MAG: Histone acetyltransferase HPA2 and related acetyltransferases [uncultured Paraburkholderia sp.]CAH2910928.1 MAG: Histone acetyltransferase HPA2 and related acetyltransferases [uncultured Paraburkholderia sp.]
MGRAGRAALWHRHTPLSGSNALRAAHRLHQIDDDHGQHLEEPLCKRAGFELVSTAPERRFGKDLMIERWELGL